MVGVGLIIAGAVPIATGYIGSVDAVYGTAYGAMAVAKRTGFMRTRQRINTADEIIDAEHKLGSPVILIHCACHFIKYFLY